MLMVEWKQSRRDFVKVNVLVLDESPYLSLLPLHFSGISKSSFQVLEPFLHYHLAFHRRMTYVFLTRFVMNIDWVQ